MSDQTSIVIVGGGLCGLIAGTQLQDYSVTIVDKGYGMGGRLASRSLKSGNEILGVFDYGMQSFQAQSSEFQSWVQHLMDEKVVVEGYQNFQGSQSNEGDTNSAYYRGVQSNRAIAQYLAKDLHVINQTRVEHLDWKEGQWAIAMTDGRIIEADAVLMTPPVPQTLEIFSRSSFQLTDEMRSRLEQIRYASCLSLMAVLDGPSSIPDPGGISLNKSPLYWVASNQKKGISPQGYAVTLLASPPYSEQNWDGETDAIIAELLAAAQEWITPYTAIATRLHRWKYSYPTAVFGARSAVINAPGPLVLAGDAFCKTPPTISQCLEQAYLSGNSAAQALSNLMNSIN